MLNAYYDRTPAVFLAHGYVGELLGKTVNGVLMHSELFDVRALVDRARAGQDTARICPGVRRSVPVVATLEEALAHDPRVLLLMGAPVAAQKPEIAACLDRGMDVVNSAFVFLRDDPDLVALAARRGGRLVDLRDVGRGGREADGSILGLSAKVVYVTGTDCGLGKRTATVELVREARARGLRAAFAATGQTGQMIGCDGAILYDAVPTNFAAGAVEGMLVELDARGFELIFLEGQAALTHFAYSASIGLLHGSNPHAIVLVHDPRRTSHAAMGPSPIFRMGSLEREIALIEGLALPGGNRFRVVALATLGEACVRELSASQALPVGDARAEGGPGVLLDAVLAHLAEAHGWGVPEEARAH